MSVGDQDYKSGMMRPDGPMINEWHLRDKAILADALKEIYSIRGEDSQVAAIVLKALSEGCVPGY